MVNLIQTKSNIYNLIICNEWNENKLAREWVPGTSTIKLILQ